MFFIKKHPCPIVFAICTVYTAVLRYLFSCFFGIDAPVYVTAPLVCVFSIFLTALCLFFSKGFDKKLKKTFVFLSAYVFPSLFWYLVSRGAYVWNSYYGGEFFFSLSLYLGGIENALFGLGMSAASLLTVILYKFVGGRNEDPRNNTK